MDFAWPDEHLELRARAREVAADGVARYGRFNDSWINGYSKDFARELAALGWIGLTWPVEFGGGGRPPVERLIIAEELISAGAPIAAMWFADRQMGPSFIAYGSGEQQQRYLPGMLSGDTTWCIGMSEPNAGSDLAGLVTSAVRDGDEFVINGQKIWTSFGDVADLMYLICRTSNYGPPHEGISEIVVPMSIPGVDVRPITDMTTNRHFCEVFISDARVPVTNLVGMEGAAFKQTMTQLEHERGGIDRLVSNKALYAMALERADTEDPARATADRRDRDRLPHRADPGHPRSAEAGAARILSGHQMLLHGTRATRRRIRGERVRRRRDRVERRRAWPALHAGLHDHGRHLEHHAQYLGERVLGLPRESR